MIKGTFLGGSRVSMTFLVPVRNISRHFDALKKQIENNLTNDDEVIFVDDNSFDTTSRLLQAWSKSNPIVSIVKNRGQQGLIPCLNLGLSVATKDWVARFDADDLYAPNRILTQSKFISEGVVAIFSDYEFVSANGRRLGMVPSAIYPLQTSLSLVMGNRTAHPSVIFNRRAAIDAGAYRAQDYLAEDLSLWLRMSRLGQLKTVPEKLLQYRLNTGSITIKSRTLSQRMRKSILTEIGINPVDVEVTLGDVDSLLSMYRNNSFGSLRKLLFLRDLREWLRINGGDSELYNMNTLQKQYQASIIKSSPFLTKSVIEKFMRDIYRKSFFISNS